MTVRRKSPASTALIDQSAAERRMAEAHLRLLIERHAAKHSRLIGSLRRSLRARLPTAHEVIYEYRDFIVISLSPSGRGFEGVLAIRATAEGVRLYFNHGKTLPDPERRLRGAGMARFVSIEAASILAHPGVVDLIAHAIACNKVPFESAGRGSVIIRQSSLGSESPKPPAKPKPPNAARESSSRSNVKAPKHRRR